MSAPLLHLVRTPVAPAALRIFAAHHGVLDDDLGYALHLALRRERESHLERVTADWSPQELAAFTDLFGRLLDDITSTLPGVPDGCDPPDFPKENP